MVKVECIPPAFQMSPPEQDGWPNKPSKNTPTTVFRDGAGGFWGFGAFLNFRAFLLALHEKALLEAFGLERLGDQPLPTPSLTGCLIEMQSPSFKVQETKSFYFLVFLNLSRFTFAVSVTLPQVWECLLGGWGLHRHPRPPGPTLLLGAYGTAPSSPLWVKGGSIHWAQIWTHAPGNPGSQGGSRR